MLTTSAAKKASFSGAKKGEATSTAIRCAPSGSLSTSGWDSQEYILFANGSMPTSTTPKPTSPRRMRLRSSSRWSNSWLSPSAPATVASRRKGRSVDDVVVAAAAVVVVAAAAAVVAAVYLPGLRHIPMRRKRPVRVALPSLGSDAVRAAGQFIAQCHQPLACGFTVRADLRLHAGGRAAHVAFETGGCRARGIE